MPIVLILILCATSYVSYKIGMGNNTVAVVATIIFLFSTILLYFSPTVIAKERKHEFLASLFALNLFLGWTFVGWVAALVWALSNRKQEPDKFHPSFKPSDPDPVTVANALQAAASGPKPQMKKCPFCAESILAEAIKCRYCGSDLSDREKNF